MPINLDHAHISLQVEMFHNNIKNINKKPPKWKIVNLKPIFNFHQYLLIKLSLLDLIWKARNRMYKICSCHLRQPLFANSINNLSLCIANLSKSSCVLSAYVAKLNIMMLCLSNQQKNICASKTKYIVRRVKVYLVTSKMHKK